ncbi:MAG: hypothetical protein WD042_06290 [Phycisphaeraceae bacterium]
MSSIDPNLIKQIADKVLAALPNYEAPRLAAAPPTPVPIHPPAGVCTGDYSKFPELAGKLYTKSVAHEAGHEEVARRLPLPSEGEGRGEGAGSATGAEYAHPSPLPKKGEGAEPPALTGIITAAQLQDAINASPDGAATLTADARLTPLANDLARQHPEKVRRLGAASIIRPGQQATDDAWLWWIDGYCPVVQQATGQRRQQLRGSSGGHQPSALAQVVRDLADAVRHKRAAGGILFVHNAARAVCYANRCSALRAVVGTCGEAVEQGIAEVGANVLVIEYPHHGLKSILAMIDRITAQLPKVPANAQRDLNELQKC